MDDLWAHPITVATYVAVLSLAVAGVKALFQLFRRVGSLEERIAQLHEDVHALATDLRTHMLEETRNVQHLEQSIQRIAVSIEDAGFSVRK